jgi:hypothetical protein
VVVLGLANAQRSPLARAHRASVLLTLSTKVRGATRTTRRPLKLTS